ncbi:MAG TPA: ATP-binding protein [Prolixibacteraceae bacterium]|nr:ATP-binding protein [Prolixibacteraceae bacterium]
MIAKDTISEVISNQIEVFFKDKPIEREIELPSETNRVIVISGIRRCGKSTLIKQKYLNENNALCINFEDPRLVGFDLNDFSRLENILTEQNKKWILLDEVQVIDKWELYVRSAHERKINVVITGSNASLLSKELGTKLTGRYQQKELFPFNYNEFLIFRKKEASLDSFTEYFEQGGFPEYLEEPEPDYHRTLLRDIIIRDIAVRRNLQNEKQLLRLAVHLLSNIGKEFSYNKLSKMLEIKSVRTVIDYCDYLTESYLVDFIPMFSWSAGKQMVNAKKAYAVDAAFAVSNSLSFSKDLGRRLENMIYNKLRASGNKVFYFRNYESECDFVVVDDEVKMVIQVCWDINNDNIDREMRGLQAAKQETGAQEGFIITYNQSDNIDGIELIPAWKWMLGYLPSIKNKNRE